MGPKLICTKDYTRFENHQHNRTLHEDPVLKASMQKYGFLALSPIACVPLKNGKLWIKKGHHRLHYAKMLGLAVWYVVDPSKQAAEVTLYEMEASSLEKWSPPDFAVSYAKSGNVECQKLLEFKKQHGLAFGISASLLGGETAGSNNKLKDVKLGVFKVDVDGTHARAVTEITDRCREKEIEFATSGHFASAVSLACRVPEFDRNRFLQKIDVHGKILSKRATTDDYLEEIEALYNYCTSQAKKLNVKFRARQESMKRYETFGGRNGSKGAK